MRNEKSRVHFRGTAGCYRIERPGAGAIIDTATNKTLYLNKSSTTLLKQGRFSHSTSKGDIYILPYDNMPCLVPDTRQIAPMPGSIQRVPDSRMPNATPGRQMIPKSKDEKKD